jgi:hypothetical protein
MKVEVANFKSRTEGIKTGGIILSSPGGIILSSPGGIILSSPGGIILS